MNSISTKLIKKIENKISGEIKCDIGTRILFSTDASIYQMLPLGVVFPRNIDDISNNYSLFAIQGPKSLDVINDIFKKDFSDLKYYNFTQVDNENFGKIR